MNRMKKITVSLDEDLAEWLKEFAKEMDSTTSAVVRASVRNAKFIMTQDGLALNFKKSWFMINAKIKKL
jgi:predicted transcriptional regulator